MAMTDKEIIAFVLSCRDEAEEAKRDRMSRNRENYDMFHLRHDFSHKREGQSQEVLSKQSMAVEQNKSFFQQALADLGDWWTAEACYPDTEQGMVVRPHEITKLTNYMMTQSGYFAHVGNSVESAMLASLVISKTSGKLVPKPRFIARKKGRGKSFRRWIEKIENKTWEIMFSLVRAENYYPDPTGRKMYEIEDSFPDFYEVLALAEGDNAIYESDIVKGLSRSGAADSAEKADVAREVGQNTTNSGHRPTVKVTEFWGTVIDPTTGEIEYENVVITIANDTDLIRPPTPNPLWHQRSPYTVSPLMEVANSVWHKAPMDAPTQHNRALIEMYNLMVDAGMMQVHAVKQIRKDALDNPGQVADGIQPGATLAVNSMLPYGAKVMEDVTAVQIPNEAFNVYNIMNQEFNSSALTNDLRQGVMPFRAVKATEVVEASQSITSVFQGMAKNYESRQSQKEIELAWMTTAQNWDMIDREVFISLFGPQRGAEMAVIPAEEVFASTVNGVRFRVYGITMTLARAQDYTKLTTLLQTISASPPLMEAFSQKYDLTKYLEEVMTSLSIDKYKLEHPKAVQATMKPGEEEQPMDPGNQGQPDTMSQVPGPDMQGAMQEMMGTPSFPQADFPGSPATKGM